MEKTNKNVGRTYLGNAFSLQMLESFPCSVTITETTMEEIAISDFTSIVGHPDTAAVLGVDCNRVSVKLHPGDVLYVAQLMGGRLPEGATELPDGYSFKFLKVTIA